MTQGLPIRCPGCGRQIAAHHGALVVQRVQGRAMAAANAPPTALTCRCGMVLLAPFDPQAEPAAA